MNDKTIESINHDSVILNKSEIKRRNEKRKDFSKQFEKTGGRRGGPGRGMYIGSKPTDTKETITRIWNYLGHYKIGLVIVAIGTVLSSVLSVFLPMLFARAIDLYILPKDYDGAYMIAAWIVVLSLFISLIRFATRYTMVIISQKTVKHIRQDAFENLQLLPVRYYDQQQSGDIVSKITNDVDLISTSLANITTQVLASLVILVGSLIMMFIENWALSLVVLAFIPIMIFITMKVSNITKKGFKAQQRHLGMLNGIIEESISGLKVLKLYSQESATINEFHEKNEELKHAGFKAQVYAGIIMPIINFMNNFIYLVIVVIGGILYITTKIAITVGDIAAITAYSRQFIRPIANLAQLFNSLQAGIAGAERVFDLIDEPTEYDEDGTIETAKLVGHVVFDNVTFGYEEDNTVLHDITFEAENGKTTAIVGPTGSGKTTIINLLNRFYDVDEGDIKIDNESIKAYKKDDLRSRIGVVLQDTNLFSGTVFENIQYGDLRASKEEVLHAATLANAHDFIMKLPQGYDSEVYEGGENFSQGERQLISIARTILSNPDILILDEATSSVDTRTEFAIQESMNTLMKGRTSFVIAHRLQTIQSADQILVIHDGRLIERGNHYELLEKEGFYYELYTTQFKELEHEIKTT